MSAHTVLLVGGTGRTGGRVLVQLLERGVPVRAIVRSASRLPDAARAHPSLTAIEVADLLALTTEQLQRHLDGCDTVISCLGHTISFRGVFGPPLQLVTRTVANLARAVEANGPPAPVRFILMSSVSVNRPARADKLRGSGERAFLATLRGLVPPARDNQRAADFFANAIGPSHRFVQWVAVRPDTLLEGPVTEYSLGEELVTSVFAPLKTNMANVAHFMCELATDDASWERWRSKMPVIVNAAASSQS